MNVTIQAIHFTAKESLEEFIQKKITKLEQFSDKIVSTDVQLKVVKPEVSNNKEVQIKVAVPNETLVVSKQADTFEGAFDEAMDAMKNMIIKAKEKNAK